MVSPFSYEPHPLCREAATLVRQYVESQPELLADAEKGKMLGVLVVETGEAGCEDGTTLGFLAAYSGLLAGRNDWPWFVPPIYDAQQPDGHFKQEERAISELNHAIAIAEDAEDLKTARQHLEAARQQAERDVEQMRKKTMAAKALRDMQRLQRNISPEERAALIRESQFMKAELHRMKKRSADHVSQCEAEERRLEQHLQDMKEERRRRSDELQQWLFEQYHLLNIHGEQQNLLEIFDGLPPAGSGDCCAPKLLQYAFENGLQPLCLAEFWWGESPRGEVRHHLHFYPPCRSKCYPILTWMLDLNGAEGEPPPCPIPRRGEHDTEGEDENGKNDSHISYPQTLPILYEDDWLAVVCKPAGMLSVPGKIARPSVEEIMKERWAADSHTAASESPLLGRGQGGGFTVHRLDMETSGLMVVARTNKAHAALQRQFLERTVSKQYVAVVEGTVVGSGTIRLPLRPDPDDRPRQLVDPVNGRSAATSYEVLSSDGERTRLLLTPETGRTHQLRVHCAHRDGLNAPIVGDELYGHKYTRLLLHAAHLAFTHPATGQPLSFDSEPPF